jgi:hypothetical protein
VRRFGILIWPVALIISLVGALVFNAGGHPELFADCLAIGAGSLWLTLAFPILRFVNTRRCFKRLFLSAYPNRSVTAEISEECIVSTIPGVSEGKFFWNAILGFVQDEKATLLYVGKARFLIIPTPAMSSEQRSELDGLVARNIVRQ